MIATHYPQPAAIVGSVVHVRFGGRSVDVPLAALNLPPRASNTQILSAVARHLEATASSLADHVVDRHANGNLTIRPEAVFG